jgi:hypothetical protein
MFTEPENLPLPIRRVWEYEHNREIFALCMPGIVSVWWAFVLTLLKLSVLLSETQIYLSLVR